MVYDTECAVFLIIVEWLQENLALQEDRLSGSIYTVSAWNVGSGGKERTLNVHRPIGGFFTVDIG